MINQNSIKLTLFQPIVYTKQPILNREDIPGTYSELIKKIDSSETGSEACIKFNYISNDGIVINIEEVGFAEPPTEEVQKAVLEGAIVPLPEHDMQVPEGKYVFIQLPYTPEKDNLFSTFLPFLCNNSTNKKGTFHLRLLKENAFAIICQVILSSKE